MPELPDVETFRRDLDHHGLDRVVAQTTTLGAPELLEALTPQALGRRLKGHRLTATRRGEAAPCPRCGGRITAIKACGRTGWYCPACQPAE